MKKLLGAAMVSVVLLLGGCSLEGSNVKLGEEFIGEVNTLEGALLTVEEVNDSATGITYVIDNQSEKDLNYGQDYGLQKEKEGKWYPVEPKDPVAITLELLWIPAGNTDTHEISWEASYGKLPKGHYRIVKSLADDTQGYYLAGEFTVQ